jgi:dihydrodipicolinate synthase/N-acetylneuraminate lyase
MLARAGALRRASAASTAASARRGMASASAAPPTFTGVWPIMATPFREDESADLESFAKCISFMNEAGCDGATIIGVLGESNRLLDAEREALIRTAVAAAGDMPICVGTSHPGTLATRGLSQMAQELGAKAVMVTPSKEGVPLADDRMVEYFAKVAEGIDISIVLQDHPASTQVNMSVPLLARLVNEIPQIANVKLESLPSPVRIPLLKSLMREDCTILTGLGALYGVFDAEVSVGSTSLRAGTCPLFLGVTGRGVRAGGHGWLHDRVRLSRGAEGHRRRAPAGSH